MQTRLKILKEYMMNTGSFLAAGLILLLPLMAWSAGSPANVNVLSVDPQVNLSKLALKRNIQVRSSRDGYVLDVHASTVLAIKAEKFVQAITGYQHYIKWKMPTLRRVQVLENSGGRRFLTWNWLSVMGVHSRHCLRAERSIPSPGAETAWVKWVLVKCPARRNIKPGVKPDPEYRDKPAFRDLQGTFYIKKLSGKQPLIYVRYYTSTRLSKSIPPAIVHLISRFRLKSDIRSMFRVLARAARSL